MGVMRLQKHMGCSARLLHWRYPAKTPRCILPGPARGRKYVRSTSILYSIDTRVMRDIRQRIGAGQRDGVPLQRWRRFALKTGCGRGTLSKTRQPEAFGTTPADNRDVALAIEFPDRRFALTIFCRLELMARNLDGAPFGKGESAERHCQRGESPQCSPRHKPPHLFKKALILHQVEEVGL